MNNFNLHAQLIQDSKERLAEKQKDKQKRPISLIAQEIASDWKKVYFGAVPYLQSMSTINSIDDRYGLDSARSIVNYFLCNASTWRGQKAREIKKELKELLK